MRSFPLFAIFVGAVCVASPLHGGSGPVATHPASLLVVNQGDHDVSLVDTSAGHQTLSVDVGGVTGHEVAVTPDGQRAFVPIYGNSGVGKPGTDGHSITVVDVKRHTVVGSIEFDHGVRPHCAVFDKKRNVLYVTTELDRSISIIDPATLKVIGAIPTGQDQSHMFVLSHSGRLGYTANVGPGTVSVLDIEARETIAVIPISGNTQRISISNDDRFVFTADQTKPQLAVIDTATNKITHWIPLPAIGYGTTPTRDGRWLLVALRDSHQVAVVDLATLKVAHTIEVPNTPTEILARPDGKLAYVSCSGDGKVAALDLSNWTVKELIPSGSGADGLAWAE